MLIIHLYCYCYFFLNIIFYYLTKATHKLQHAIWVFMVSFLTTREEKSELFNTFKTLDLNGDGQLTRDELLTGNIAKLIFGNNY